MQTAKANDKTGSLPFDPTKCKDLTPDSLKGKIKVYKTSEMNSSIPTYVVKEKNCLSIGNSFGGQGVYAVIAADLNGDNQAEIVYASSWGSGMHRTNIGAVEISSDLKDYTAQDMLLFEDEEIKLLPAEGKATLLVRNKPYADIVFETSKDGKKKLVLKKISDKT